MCGTPADLPQAASWLLEWERRGPRWEEAKNKLTNTLVGIASLKNGFVTGSGLYNPVNGSLEPPPEDPTNNGTVAVSHLSAVFGLMEVIAELTEHYGESGCGSLGAVLTLHI